MGRRCAADNYYVSRKSSIGPLHRMHPSQPHCLCWRNHAKGTSCGLLLGSICRQDHSLAKTVQAEDHHSLSRGHHVLRGCNVHMGRGCSELGAFAPLCRSRAPCSMLPCLSSCLLCGVYSCMQCQHCSDSATSSSLSPPLTSCCLLICLGSCRIAIPMQAALDSTGQVLLQRRRQAAHSCLLHCVHCRQQSLCLGGCLPHPNAGSNLAAQTYDQPTPANGLLLPNP